MADPIFLPGSCFLIGQWSFDRTLTPVSRRKRVPRVYIHVTSSFFLNAGALFAWPRFKLRKEQLLLFPSSSST